jgi:hypothetical protein
VIWAKTDEGRAEMQTRALVKDRARRNLLLLIDGTKSEEMLLGSLTGITAADFQELRKLDLIAPAAGAVTVGGAARPANADSNRPTVPQALANATAAAPSAQSPLERARFTAVLTQMISANLGLRGFTLALAVDKASTAEELREVAQRMLEQVRERKGEAVAAEARRILYGD